MRLRPVFLILFRLVVLAGLLLSPVVRAGAQPLGAVSPDELVERFNDATAKGEVASKLSLLSPTARSMHTLSLLFATAMIVAMDEVGDRLGEPQGGEAKPPKRAAELDAVLGRHGFTERMEKMQSESPLEADTEEERDRRLAKLFEGVDTIALATDLEALVKKASGGQFRPTTWKVSDPEVEGDRGTVSAGEQKIDILRIDGRWYLEPKGPPPPGSPPG